MFNESILLMFLLAVPLSGLALLPYLVARDSRATTALMNSRFNLNNE